MNTAEAIQFAKKFVVQILAGEKRGSGFYYHEYEYVITTHDLVEDYWVVTVEGSYIENQAARVLYIDPVWNIAVIKLSQSIKPLNYPVGSINSIIVEKAPSIALGYAYGEEFTASVGTLSKKNRLRNGIAYIRTSAKITPENSGGPLIDANGVIIGMNVFMENNEDDYGYAIWLNYIVGTINVAYTYENLYKAVIACPGCHTPVHRNFIDDFKYCVRCGTEVKLPDFEIHSESQNTEKNKQVVSFVEKAIRYARFQVDTCRMGYNTWVLKDRKLRFEIKYQPEAGTVYINAIIAEITKNNQPELYNFILSENNNTDAYYFTMRENYLFLCASINHFGIPPEDAAEIIKLIMDKGVFYAETIGNRYEADILYTEN
ncbi:MAG: trypsin-like peptidase domain-containing protein [Brumimicrobium sp.]|nr:trypsin-like peptidase domain-containing protein [Brumimicrobium sp.]MCO5267460.1 trypsin-like peptidase domain-containing protein [Brumimicrobium sp.]